MKTTRIYRLTLEMYRRGIVCDNLFRSVEGAYSFAIDQIESMRVHRPLIEIKVSEDKRTIEWGVPTYGKFPNKYRIVDDTLY